MSSKAKDAKEFAVELMKAWNLICEYSKGPRTWHCPVSTESSRQARWYRGMFRRIVNRINRYGSHPFADFIFERRGTGSVGDAVRAFDWKAHGVTP